MAARAGSRPQWAWVALTAALASGCTVQEDVPEDVPPGCAPGQTAFGDGSCHAVGVPPAACAKGFVADAGGGCSPVLPPADCPPGKMAVPGDTACRDVAPCADGRWGDIPVEANTQFVDAAYAGGGSDGTKDKPWTSLPQATSKAANGAIVAVAAGSYTMVFNKTPIAIGAHAVRIWGRCPALVEIVGSTFDYPALQFQQGADGSEVRGVAFRSAGHGVIALASKITLRQVWIHDTAQRGIQAQSLLAPTSVTLVDSLIERAHEIGFGATGAEAVVERSVIRGTLPDASQLYGRGFDVERGKSGAQGTVRGSLIERNRDAGVFVAGASLVLDASVIRNTDVVAAGGTGGSGLSVQDNSAGERATVAVSASVFDGNHDAGLTLIAADATVETTVARATLPDAHGDGGRGLQVADDAATKQRGKLTLRNCLVDANHDVGLLVGGSDALVEGTVVRGTLPLAGGHWGRGVAFQSDSDGGARSTGVVRGSLVEGNREVGVEVLGSDVTVEGSEIRGTLAAGDGAFGDGVFVIGLAQKTAATLNGCRVEKNARGGVTNFSATVSLSGARVACNGFDLDGENYQMKGAPNFVDQGGNGCGCPEQTGLCKVLSASLAAPEPIVP